MPAGLPYFAWIDVGETTFTGGHLRWDEEIFSFTLSQEEGDPASLTIAVRRPRNVAGVPIGLLGAGRKIWCWFALDCGPALITFRGRLVGIPTSIFEDLVTLEFVARPADLVAQKEALAASLRVLPYYDEAVIDPARRSDPDVVLEGYTKIWAYDRSSHEITVSDEIIGEDGLVEFDGVSEEGKVLYDGLGLTLTSGPLTRVDVNAEFTWTQQASGTVDLTSYLISHWPGSVGGQIPSLNASDWPKHGAGLGDGWEVAESTAQDVFDFTVHTTSKSGSSTSIMVDGSTATSQWSSSSSGVSGAPLVYLGVISNESSYSYAFEADPSGQGSSSSSRSYSTTAAMLGVQSIIATLVAGYKAGRQFTERVSFSLVADVQHILTDPEDGEALRIDDIKSVNLSEGQIVDPRRRSYVATERGVQSVEHLIAVARAHLMKRSRVVEIKFAPKLSRMPEITLRKNAVLIEPRVGEAVGKIIGYSIALDGADGRVNCEVTIGCAIGRGGFHETTAGGPVYAAVNYTGPDYQQFYDRVVLLDTSVGYQPPNSAPNDDGINFLSGLSAEDVIESHLVVEHGPDPGDVLIPTNSGSSAGSTPEQTQGLITDRDKYIQEQIIAQYDTRARFKLKSMSGEFSTNYEIHVTDLKVPTGYDLEAV